MTIMPQGGVREVFVFRELKMDVDLLTPYLESSRVGNDKVRVL